MWIVSSIVGAVAWVAVTSVVTIVNPDIPSYKAELLNWPRFTKLNNNYQEIQAIINASLSVDYNNYVTTDIHAASIDLFYPDWDGQLVLIGQVQDTHHHHNNNHHHRHASIHYSTHHNHPAKSTTNNDDDNNHNHNNNHKKTKTKKKKQKARTKKPFWTMSPRSLFQQHSQFHYTMPLPSLWKVSARLLWQASRRKGWVSVPSGGVTHIKSFAAKLTVSMICDTQLNIFTLDVVGDHCRVHRIVSGWNDQSTETQKLRQHMLSQRVDSSTGTILNRPKGGSTEDQQTKDDILLDQTLFKWEADNSMAGDATYLNF